VRHLIREAVGADRGASVAREDPRRRGDVVSGEDRRGCALRGDLGHHVPADASSYVLQWRGLRGCGARPRGSPESISPVMSFNREGRSREREREY
jgi:hypothetical protein